MNGHLDGNDPRATLPAGDRSGDQDHGFGAQEMLHRLRTTPVLPWGGALLLAALLGWISPVLLLLAALVTGIGWLCYTGADPAHWGPVPPPAAAGRRAPLRAWLRRPGDRPADEGAPVAEERRPPPAPAAGRVTAGRRSRPGTPSRRGHRTPAAVDASKAPGRPGGSAGGAAAAGRTRRRHPSMP
jgi:hypothetical protein